ncbi:MAG: hypothetical protein ACRDP6_14590 [Actinoallomurus sp.]
MSSYADRQKTLIDEALTLTDPAERACALSDILGTVKDANAEMKATRQRDVLELRDTRTLAVIAELLGMSIGRVDQIAKGK